MSTAASPEAMIDGPLFEHTATSYETYSTSPYFNTSYATFSSTSTTYLDRLDYEGVPMKTLKVFASYPTTFITRNATDPVYSYNEQDPVLSTLSTHMPYSGTHLTFVTLTPYSTLQPIPFSSALNTYEGSPTGFIIGALLSLLILIGISLNLGAYSYWIRKVKGVTGLLCSIIHLADVLVSVSVIPVTMSFLFHPSMFSYTVLCAAWAYHWRFVVLWMMFLTLLIAVVTTVELVRGSVRRDAVVVMLMVGTLVVLGVSLFPLVLETHYGYNSQSGVCGVRLNVVELEWVYEGVMAGCVLGVMACSAVSSCVLISGTGGQYRPVGTNCKPPAAVTGSGNNPPNSKLPVTTDVEPPKKTVNQQDDENTAISSDDPLTDEKIKYDKNPNGDSVVIKIEDKEPFEDIVNGKNGDPKTVKYVKQKRRTDPKTLKTSLLFALVSLAFQLPLNLLNFYQNRLNGIPNIAFTVSLILFIAGFAVVHPSIYFIRSGRFRTYVYSIFRRSPKGHVRVQEPEVV